MEQRHRKSSSSFLFTMLFSSSPIKCSAIFPAFSDNRLVVSLISCSWWGKRDEKMADWRKKGLKATEEEWRGERRCSIWFKDIPAVRQKMVFSFQLISLSHPLLIGSIWAAKSGRSSALMAIKMNWHFLKRKDLSEVNSMGIPIPSSVSSSAFNWERTRGGDSQEDAAIVRESGEKRAVEREETEGEEEERRGEKRECGACGGRGEEEKKDGFIFVFICLNKCLQRAFPILP